MFFEKACINFFYCAAKTFWILMKENEIIRSQDKIFVVGSRFVPMVFSRVFLPPQKSTLEEDELLRDEKVLQCCKFPLLVLLLLINITY